MRTLACDGASKPTSRSEAGVRSWADANLSGVSLVIRCPGLGFPPDRLRVQSSNAEVFDLELEASDRKSVV